MQALQQLAEEPLGRFGIAPALHENVENAPRLAFKDMPVTFIFSPPAATWAYPPSIRLQSAVS
jgi:hypothetical protein